MTEGQQFSVQVTDSCLTSFSVNLTTASLTNGSLVWEQGHTVGVPHCKGDTVHLTALSFPPPATYQWTGPNGFTSTAHSNDIILTHNNQCGWYKVKILNSLCGSTIYDSIYLTIAPEPQVTITGDTIACPGAAFSLSFIPQGYGQVSFDVFHSNGHDSYTVNANDTLTQSYSLLEDGVFWVNHIADEYCPSSALVDSFHVGIYFGDAGVTDFYDTIVEDYLPYNFFGQMVDTEGEYMVTLKNMSGCDSTVNLHLTILPYPEISISVTTNTVCVGDSAILQAVIENAGLFTPPPVPPVALGDILCTDSSIVKPADFAASGKTALGIVFFVDSTGLHGWAMDLYDLEGREWTSSPSDYFDVPTLDNIANSRDAIADFDGYGNTLKLRAAGDSTLLPAAWAVDLEHGWYLPAIGQLSQMYANIVLLNASLQIAGGTPFPMNEPHFRWSSSENDINTAWNLVYGGSVRMDLKGVPTPIRSVRDF